MKNLLFITVLFCSLNVLAAESTTTSLKTEASSGAQNDIDTQVLDAKLRAQSGSKSKWSGTMNFSYYGASLKKPLGDERPNVSNSLVAPPTRAGGNVGLRYRLEPGESLFFATGFSQVRPFSGRDDDELEVSSPQIMWNNTGRVQDIQLSSSWHAYYITSDYLRAVGQRSMLAYNISALRNPNQGRADYGISTNAWYAYHDKDDARTQTRQADYGFAISPMVQYRVSDGLKVYTSLELFNYSHTRSNVSDDFTRAPVTQNVGAAIAVKRDIYLAPHLQFRPSDMSSSKTAVNLSATVNVF